MATRSHTVVLYTCLFFSGSVFCFNYDGTKYTPDYNKPICQPSGTPPHIPIVKCSSKQSYSIAVPQHGGELGVSLKQTMILPPPRTAADSDRVSIFVSQSAEQVTVRHEHLSLQKPEWSDIDDFVVIGAFPDATKSCTELSDVQMTSIETACSDANYTAQNLCIRVRRIDKAGGYILLNSDYTSGTEHCGFIKHQTADLSVTFDFKTSCENSSMLRLTKIADFWTDIQSVIPNNRSIVRFPSDNTELTIRLSSPSEFTVVMDYNRIYNSTDVHSVLTADVVNSTIAGDYADIGLSALGDLVSVGGWTGYTYRDYPEKILDWLSVVESSGWRDFSTILRTFVLIRHWLCEPYVSSPWLVCPVNSDCCAVNSMEHKYAVMGAKLMDVINNHIGRINLLDMNDTVDVIGNFLGDVITNTTDGYSHSVHADGRRLVGPSLYAKASGASVRRTFPVIQPLDTSIEWWDSLLDTNESTGRTRMRNNTLAVPETDDLLIKTELYTMANIYAALAGNTTSELSIHRTLGTICRSESTATEDYGQLCVMASIGMGHREITFTPESLLTINGYFHGGNMHPSGWRIPLGGYRFNSSVSSGPGVVIETGHYDYFNIDTFASGKILVSDTYNAITKIDMTLTEAGVPNNILLFTKYPFYVRCAPVIRNIKILETVVVNVLHNLDNSYECVVTEAEVESGPIDVYKGDGEQCANYQNYPHESIGVPSLLWKGLKTDSVFIMVSEYPTFCETTTLVAETTLPADTTTLAAETTTLVADTTTLAADTTTLAAETTTLVADTTTLAADTTTLAAETTTLVAETTTLAADTTTLVAETTLAADTTTLAETTRGLDDSFVSYRIIDTTIACSLGFSVLSTILSILSCIVIFPS